MPIKNSHIRKKDDPGYYISLVQQSLIKHGATGMQMMFDGEGRISAIAFTLPAPTGGQLSFQLPCEWRKFQLVMKSQKVSGWQKDTYCYAVAWANIKDWVEAQMALYETAMVSLPQIFLPFVTTKSGQTLFELVANNPSSFLLEESNS